MGKGFLVFIFLLCQHSFSAEKISDYFGSWKGSAQSNKNYSIYLNFKGLGESNEGYWNAFEANDEKKGYYGTFIAEQGAKNCFLIKIRLGKSKLNMLRFSADACLHKNRITIDSFLSKGDITFTDKDTAVFKFDGDGGKIRGRLKRIKPSHKKDSSDSPIKSKPVFLAPVKIEKKELK